MLYVDNPRDTAPKRLGRGDFEALIGDSDVARGCMWTRRYAEALHMARERGVSSDAVTPLRAHGVCEQAPTHSREHGVSSDAVTPLRAHGVCEQAPTHSRGVALQTEWWERELKQAKGKLPAFIFQGDMASADYLGKPGTRNGRYIVSNGKAMIDIDHIGHEEIDRIMRTIYTIGEEDGTPFIDRVGFVAITPSGMGLRIVINGRPGSTLVGDQRWVARLLGVAIDECCKDYTRLSYAVPWCHVLYYEPEVLFAECTPYSDSQRDQRDQRYPEPLSTLSPLMDTFGIVDELERELGGPPAVGTRNTFVYRMACALRHLYGDNEASIYCAIPTYGLTDAERRGAIRSALNRPLGTYVPRCIYRSRR